MLVRLNKILQDASIASRRASDQLIASGKVTVNGRVVKELGSKADPSKDMIKVEGKLIKKPQAKITYVLNKPAGYICSNRRLNNEKIVLDLLPKSDHRLFTVGRLDKDAKGLIFITNDGDFANKVIHPSSNISKEYIVKVAKEIEEEDLKTMSEGVFIDRDFVKPHKIVKIRRGTLRVVLKDGKKHEVKALIEKANLPLIELKRVRIGNYKLGALPEGAVQKVSNKERNQIFE